jgi:hypothetical protein
VEQDLVLRTPGKGDTVKRDVSQISLLQGGEYMRPCCCLADRYDDIRTIAAKTRNERLYSLQTFLFSLCIREPVYGFQAKIVEIAAEPLKELKKDSVALVRPKRSLEGGSRLAVEDRVFCVEERLAGGSRLADEQHTDSCWFVPLSKGLYDGGVHWPEHYTHACSTPPGKSPRTAAAASGPADTPPRAPSPQ